MRKRGGDREDELRVLGRVLCKKSGRAGIKLQVPESESERANGFVIVVVPFPFSALPRWFGSIHAHVFLVHRPS
jgi:hypothetical protein